MASNLKCKKINGRSVLSSNNLSHPIDINKKLQEDTAALGISDKLNQETCSVKIEEAEWLTTVQAANFLQLPIGTLRNLTSNGKIPYYKLGRSNRYRREELRNLLLANKRGVSHGY